MITARQRFQENVGYMLTFIGTIVVLVIICVTIGFCYYMKYDCSKVNAKYTNGYFDGYTQGRYDERGFGE